MVTISKIPVENFILDHISNNYSSHIGEVLLIKNSNKLQYKINILLPNCFSYSIDFYIPKRTNAIQYITLTLIFLNKKIVKYFKSCSIKFY